MALLEERLRHPPRDAPRGDFDVRHAVAQTAFGREDGRVDAKVVREDRAGDHDDLDAGPTARSPLGCPVQGEQRRLGAVDPHNDGVHSLCRSLLRRLDGARSVAGSPATESSQTSQR